MHCTCPYFGLSFSGSSFYLFFTKIIFYLRKTLVSAPVFLSNLPFFQKYPQFPFFFPSKVYNSSIFFLNIIFSTINSAILLQSFLFTGESLCISVHYISLRMTFTAGSPTAISWSTSLPMTEVPTAARAAVCSNLLLLTSTGWFPSLPRFPNIISNITMHYRNTGSATISASDTSLEKKELF